MKKTNILLLSIVQALFQSSSVIVFSISGIASLTLIQNRGLATLPIGVMLLFATLCLIPAGILIKKIGSKESFKLGAMFGFTGGALCALGLYSEKFYILICGHIFLGIFQSFSQFYRFAALENVSNEDSSFAISCVTAGGVIASFLGPLIVFISSDINELQFTLPYIGIALLSFSNYVICCFLISTVEKVNIEKNFIIKSDLSFLKNRDFRLAVLMSCTSFSVMILLMSATPIEMLSCGNFISQTNYVIQWHVFAMYSTSFISWWLIKKFGTRFVIAFGLSCICMQSLVSISGNSYNHFVFALVLLGIGWNFVYISSSSSLASVYNNNNKHMVQSLHDLLMLLTITCSTLLSGISLELIGWNYMNLAALVLCSFAGITFFCRNLSK